ncbi:MAG: chemotaxis protein CheW [Thermodesulfobacteriota bacterium]|nr:chemotaxis protein CheW [Thermodesulfobacteriota bacterium]
MSTETKDVLNADFFDDDDDENEDAQKDMYFTFKVGEEEYGVDISCVLEVAGIQKITEVPDMPDFVKGVINLRGQVIPVIDVRLRFKMEPMEYNDRTCILVVTIKEMSVGLIVDQVRDVVHIKEDNVEPPPKMSNKPGARYIKGLGKLDEEVKILLDLQKLLYDEELEKIEAAVE